MKEHFDLPSNLSPFLPPPSYLFCCCFVLFVNTFSKHASKTKGASCLPLFLSYVIPKHFSQIYSVLFPSWHLHLESLKWYSELFLFPIIQIISFNTVNNMNRNGGLF